MTRLLRHATLVLLGLSFATICHAAPRPNFVWIVSEDNSIHYQKQFFPGGIATPNIEKLAAEGILYQNAFSNSPVCSVARTTLGTSVYAPKLAAQLHRKLRPAAMPQGWKFFSAYLRDAGYYATNRSKTDYNAGGSKGAWDRSAGNATWKNRPIDKPFFHMESHPDSHEGRLHFRASQMKPKALTVNPKDVKLFPYFPDTKLFRYTHAYYLERQLVIDKIVGRVVKDLTDAGLLEDTFIFYFGDHGGVLPRSKGYLYESGLNVPLVVRVPKNFRHLVDAKVGSKSSGFVSFVDFGPTVLKLAGAEVPKHMDGRPFLGQDIEQAEVDARDETFGYADRFDERYELVRSLRKGRYKYIRNYQAFYPDSLQNNYRYRQLAYAQWRKMYRDGKLNDVQRQFFEPRAAEGLYDIETDPHEVKNLASDPKHAKTLVDLRTRLQKKIKGLPDLGFYPESFLVEKVLGAPIAYGKSHAAEIGTLVDTADLATLPFDQAKGKLSAALASDNAWVRYWALNACSVFGKKATSLAPTAKSLLADPELLVRLRAIEFLGIATGEDPRPALMAILKESKSPVVSCLTLNTVVFFKDGTPGYDFRLTSGDVTAKDSNVKRRLSYLKGKPAIIKGKKKRRK